MTQSPADPGLPSGETGWNPSSSSPAQPIPSQPDPEPTVRIRPYLQAATSAGGAGGADAGLAPADRFSGTSGHGVGGPDQIGASEPGFGTVPPTYGLRPFVLTCGRVESADPAISLETQVTVRPEGPSWTGQPLDRLAPELQNIVTLCVEPLSVAEISARLRLHLGVTKILVSDLRAAGHLDVHTSDVEHAHDPDIILRVIDGLRAIS